MTRDYHIDIARHAANTDPKWVDNLLSHFDIPGVAAGGQGVSRRVSVDGVYHVALIRSLTLDIGVTTGTAVSMAARLLAAGGEQRVAMAPWLELQFDRQAFKHAVDAAVTDAVESVTPARRGRPPARDR
jgi:hypothetical protein